MLTTLSSQRFVLMPIKLHKNQNQTPKTGHNPYPSSKNTLPNRQPYITKSTTRRKHGKVQNQREWTLWQPAQVNGRKSSCWHSGFAQCFPRSGSSGVPIAASSSSSSSDFATYLHHFCQSPACVGSHSPACQILAPDC